MINYSRVRSTQKPEPIVVDEYSVWVCTDIAEISVEFEGEVHTEYEFNQVRYLKDEYIKLMDAKSRELEAGITDTQLALCEIYEGMI